MISRFAQGQEWGWSGVQKDRYKDEPGTWESVVRQVLSPDGETTFQVRYFEIAPDGYTSYEMHRHEHCVIVLRGKGRVKLGGEWHDLYTNDLVRVPGETPHQFLNPYKEPFGIVCVVDKDRDKPVLLDPNGMPRSSDA